MTVENGSMRKFSRLIAVLLAAMLSFAALAEGTPADSPYAAGDLADGEYAPDGFRFSGGKVISDSKDLGFGGASDDTVTSKMLDFMKLENGFLGVLYN